jgi:hypothetical protein
MSEDSIFFRATVIIVTGIIVAALFALDAKVTAVSRLVPALVCAAPSGQLERCPVDGGVP